MSSPKLKVGHKVHIKSMYHSDLRDMVQKICKGTLSDIHTITKVAKKNFGTWYYLDDSEDGLAIRALELAKGSTYINQSTGERICIE